MAQHSPYAVAWRIPSIILTSLEPLIIFLGITLGNPRDVRRLIGGAVGAMVFPIETITATVGALALLDTYAAFFITLAVALAINRRWGLAAVAMGLALASKETALPFIIALAIYYYLNSNESLRDRIITSLALILGPLAIAALSYAPIVAYLGLKNTVLGIETTLHWDLQNRPSGPVPSSPIDWFFGVNAMIGGIITETIKVGNNYIVKQLLLRFSMNPYVEAPAFIIALGYFVYSLLARRAVPRDLGTVFLVTGFVIFSVIYMFNHTFYSFYSIVFVPVTAMIWSEVISSVYPDIRSVRRAIGSLLSELAEGAEEGA
jgi:predicted membrane-bound dolichyl-phosphate-mannose-protein mannosyltransferase